MKGKSLKHPNRNFSKATVEGQKKKKKKNDTFKLCRENNCKSRMLYPAESGSSIAINQGMPTVANSHHERGERRMERILPQSLQKNPILPTS